MYLIDGSNLAGVLFDDSYNRLDTFKAVMNWGRARKNKILLFFDGPPDEDFSRDTTSFGNVRVQLIYPRQVDGVIIDEVRKNPSGCVAITSDRALSDKIRGLRGQVIASHHFARKLNS